MDRNCDCVVRQKALAFEDTRVRRKQVQLVFVTLVLFKRSVKSDLEKVPATTNIWEELKPCYLWSFVAGGARRSGDAKQQNE